MSAVRLEQITGGDPGLRQALVAADLPTDDIEDDGRIAGFSGLEHCGSDYLLRSVVVLSDHRGGGLGRALVEATLTNIGDDGDVFLATTHTAPFFARLGFVDVPRQSGPGAVLATRQLSSICQSSATIMKFARPST